MSGHAPQRLRGGEALEIEGVHVEYVGEWTALEPGDWYVAERNGGPRLLTVREVKEFLGDRDEYLGAVFPVESAYPYDLGECVKVRVLDLEPQATTRPGLLEALAGAVDAARQQRVQS